MPQRLWIPEDIVLEDAAVDVVRSEYNTLVVAGPGAGKTELLAQRACYLLQTNTCPYPRRILAVSFKKDSASNLGDRVSKRCGYDLAYRMDSFTFDKFCKELLDRFILALPLSFRPSKDYRVDINNELLNQAYELAGYQRQRFNPQDSRPKYPKRVVEIMVKGFPEKEFLPALNFNLISRFALYILQHNPYILTSLQKTYSHVFLDEFQDTTSLQYEVVTTCFKSSSSVITAVGDQKQRIMLWAGAMPDAFGEYSTDFNAIEKTMLTNHRSAPNLLLLQQSLYKSLNEKEIEIKPSKKWNPDDGRTVVAVFTDDESEQRFICENLVELINSGIKPRDICILVKRSIDEYLGDILGFSVTDNVKVRNENVFQDLLKEDAAKIIIAAIYSAITTSKPDIYLHLQAVDLILKGVDIDDSDKVNTQCLSLSIYLDALSSKLETIGKTDGTRDELATIVDDIFSYLGEKEYCDMYPHYSNGDLFNQVKNSVIDNIWGEFCLTLDWEKALNNFEGENSIPAMTIHKSKGLEYDVVFVVGVEDAAFFARGALSQEDVSAFFVAVSRAKQQLFITTANERDNLQNSGGVQTRTSVKLLYDALKSSGVVQIQKYS